VWDVNVLAKSESPGKRPEQHTLAGWLACFACDLLPPPS
jgi:hypothetical protein